MSLNERHHKLITPSATFHSKSFPKTVPGEENGENECGARLCDEFSLVARNDDFPSFSGITDFDSPSPPNPLAGLQEECVKVRVAGMRRLCKISKKDEKCDNEKNANSRNEEAKFTEILDLDSPAQVKDEAHTNYDSGRNEIRDILDDLSSKLDFLSIEKKREPKKISFTKDSRHTADNDVHMEKKEISAYGSATSSFSIISDCSSSPWKESRIEDAFLNEPKRMSSPDNEPECISSLWKVKKTKDFGEGPKRHNGKISGKSDPKIKSLGAMEEEDEADDCVILGENCLTKNVDRLHIPEDADDLILEDQSIVLDVPKSIYRLPGKIAKMLFPHQREGLNWLWSLHCKGKGGVLGDDMGLGKTMQICGFLAGLFRSNLIKRALIVAPKTLLPHWIKELSVVGLSEKTREYFGTNVSARQYEL